MYILPIFHIMDENNSNNLYFSILFKIQHLKFCILIIISSIYFYLFFKFLKYLTFIYNFSYVYLVFNLLMLNVPKHDQYMILIINITNILY